MNANNVSVNTSIGANTEFSYGKSLGIEFRPALSRLKGRFRNIYLNIDFSQGGFLKKNIHPLINYEVRKIYKINYRPSTTSNILKTTREDRMFLWLISG